MKWLLTWLQETFTELWQLFVTPVFEIGNTRYSLSLIVTLLLVSVAVFWVSRSISNVINRRLLVRLRLDRGTREVVTTFIRYGFTVLGFVIVLQTAGVNLSSLTLFAGVLGIGLGFGLQNLASNFISGLTLLIEQPIRVGDFIEVDQLLGTVERISIRSTAVRTLDGVFVIVPNIKFVENNVINWSYRDPRCRVHIPVGIAYGSNTSLVSEALLAAADKESKVLANPAPKVWFRGFGDSSLNFELLVWIDQPTEGEPIKSSLNFLIERELQVRGIEIPFPQRDLTIRNVEEIAPLLQAPAPPNGSARQHESPAQNPPAVPSELRFAPAQPSPNQALQNALQQYPYFRNCTSAELAHLIESADRQQVAAYETVCEAGSTPEAMYVVISGSVDLFSQADEQYIKTLGEGESVGELSLLVGVPQAVTVKALEETTLLVLERHHLKQLFAEHPECIDRIAQSLLLRQKSLNQMGILSSSDMAEAIRDRLKARFV